MISGSIDLEYKIIAECAKRDTEAPYAEGPFGNAYGWSSSRTNRTAYALCGGD
jgi:hypothetical protein